MLFIIFISQPSYTFIFRNLKFGFFSTFLPLKSFFPFCVLSRTAFVSIFFFSKKFFGSFCAFSRKFFLGQTRFFYSRLLLKGIGFKGVYDPVKRFFHMELGFNNVSSLVVPSSIFIKSRKNRVVLYSLSVSLLNRFISSIRAARLPDPYRGKGIRYHNQYIKFKVGKQR